MFKFANVRKMKNISFWIMILEKRKQTLNLVVNRRYTKYKVWNVKTIQGSFVVSN